ncbi:hypothetical protein [Paenibacillus sp. sgz500992]
MNPDFYTNELMRQALVEFLRGAFNYDGTLHLLAVSARRDETNMV